MDNPQLEDGYTRIANEIFEQLAQTQLSGHEWRMLVIIWRKTYGWKKKQDMISLTQFMKLTGLSKSRCSEALSSLEARRIIKRGVPENRNTKARSYQFNKHFRQWIRVPEKRNGSGKAERGVPKNRNEGFQKTGTTKETITKETIQKKTTTGHDWPDFDLFWAVYPKKVEKKYAIRCWNKAKPPIDQVMTALRWQVPYWHLKDQTDEFIPEAPNPSTYINRGRWEDEPPTYPKSKNDKRFIGTLKSLYEFAHEDDLGNEKPHHAQTEPIAGLIEPLVIDV